MFKKISGIMTKFQWNSVSGTSLCTLHVLTYLNQNFYLYFRQGEERSQVPAQDI